jgi:predicted chitinase
MKENLREEIKRQKEIMLFLEQGQLGQQLAQGLTQAIKTGLGKSLLDLTFGDGEVNVDDLKSDDFKGDVSHSGKIKHKYSGEAGRNVDLMIQEMEKMGITNPVDQVGILSVIAKESGFRMTPEKSYSNTSNPRIRSIFGNRVSGLSDQQLSQLKKNEAQFFETVYGVNSGKRLGNTEPGDGYKYRGRGFNQLTGRSNYKKYGSMSGVDLEGNPDLLNDPRVAAKVAILFFTKGNKNFPNFSNPSESSKYFSDLNAGGTSSRGRTLSGQALNNFEIVA